MKVIVVLGSKSDEPVAKKCTSSLQELGIDYEVLVSSAHRTPGRTVEIAEREDASLFIAIAGLSAALPGVLAAHTAKPIIGVPVSGKVNLDSILSIVQMPPGIPVAAVGLDNGKNAAVLAASILAIGDEGVRNRLLEYRSKMASNVAKDSDEMKQKLAPTSGGN